MGSAEEAIEMLKKLHAPSGDGDNGAGVLDALKDIEEKLRAEFDKKLSDLDNQLGTKLDGV